MNEEITKWIDEEKRLDRKVRRISYGAWIATLIVVLVYGVTVVSQAAWHLHVLALVGTTHGRWEMVRSALDQLTPLLVVLGVLSLLVALLGTIGMLVRFRTASLAEIQVRLAAMEGMLMNDRREE